MGKVLASRARRLGAAVALVGVVLIGMAAQPASAAQPPAGYRTDEVMAKAGNPEIGTILIRRGFWDAVPDQGFGMDKVWNKHNIWSVSAMKAVLLSPNVEHRGGDNYTLTAYAGKYKCNKNHTSCTITHQLQIDAAVSLKKYDKYYNWPVKGQLGLKTMFCQQEGIAKCPTWVTYSILYPHSPNPYRNVTSMGADASSTLDPGLRAQQARVLQSPEIKSLKAELAAGTTALVFSYEPLPRVIPAP